MKIQNILMRLGEAATMLLFLLLAWLFLAVTPDQFSAECEILRAEMEAGQ